MEINNYKKINLLSGKESVSMVEILDEKKISYGAYGDIFEATVLVNGRQRKMILKRFKDGLYSGPGERDSKEMNAQRAFENHTFLKKEGFTVFPTYRLNEKDSSILMTNGDESGYVCIGNNYHSPTLESRGYEKVDEIKNFEELVDSLLNESKKATEKQILLPKDSYMFLLNIQNHEAQFVIGDLDLVEQSSRFEYDFLLEKNSEYSISALFGFVEQSTKIPKQNEYFRYLNKLKERIITD